MLFLLEELELSFLPAAVLQHFLEFQILELSLAIFRKKESSYEPNPRQRQPDCLHRNFLLSPTVQKASKSLSLVTILLSVANTSFVLSLRLPPHASAWDLRKALVYFLFCFVPGI